MHGQTSLDSLAPGADCGRDAPTTHADKGKGGYGGGGGNPAWAVVWFIIIAIIIWLILAGSRPEFVQRKDDTGCPTGEVDQGLAVLWAVIIAIVICIILGIIVWLFNAGRRC